MTQLRHVIGSLLFITSSAAGAQELSLNSACPAPDGPSSVDPVALLYTALFTAGTYRAGSFDADSDGTETQRERITAVLAPSYCRSLPAGRCGKNDQATLDRARILLITFLNNRTTLTRKTTPTIEEAEAFALLDDEDKETARSAQALDERRRYFDLTCRPAPLEPTPTPSENRFRLVGGLDGLAMKRGNPDLLAAIPQAEISWVDDNAAKRSTFDLNAIVGYSFGDGKVGFTPFLQARIKRIDDEAAAPGAATGDISKWAIGANISVFREDSLNAFSFAPLYAIDDEEDSRIAALRATWTPGYLHRVPKLPYESSITEGRVAWKLVHQWHLHAGKVIDAGDSAKLADQEHYARGGFSLGLVFWLLPKELAASRLSADASYRNLFRITGDHNATSWTVGLNFSPEKNDHFTFRLSYEDVVDEETLTEFEGWKLSFGVRY